MSNVVNLIQGECLEEMKNIPDDVEQQIRSYEKQLQRSAEKIIIPAKHKYVYVLGASKLETKRLRKEFESCNKIYSYPKERGK